MPVVILYEGITGEFSQVIATFPRHSAYVDEFAKSGDLIAIGTFENPAENGSMGIFRTREAAERFIVGDPFQLEGLIANTRVLNWGAGVHGALTSGGLTVENRSIAGVVALLLASLLWGTTGTSATFFPDNVSPLAIGACTMGVGGLLLVVASPRLTLAVLRDRSARRWVALGAIGVFVYPLAFYSAMNLAGVAVGNVVALGTGPVFAALYEWMGERHPLSRRWAVSTAVAVLGIVCLTIGRQAGAHGVSAATFAGVGLGLLAGAAYALYTYASSRAIRSGEPSRGVMGAMFGIGAVLLLPVLLVTGAPLLQSWSTVAIAGYLAIGPMFVAYLLFGIGLRTVRSSAATTITLLEPVVATLLAVLVVGERLAPVGWIGLLLVFTGLAILLTARREPEKGTATLESGA